MKCTPASRVPSAFCGLYSRSTCPKDTETLSIGCSELPDGCTLVMKTSFILTIRYSCCPLPALRDTSVASGKWSPIAQAFISTGDALSTACMKLRSLKFAWPAPLPPRRGVPLLDTPHDQERTSISPTCLLSFDSPLT